MILDLAAKYRPLQFSDCIGQDDIKNTLMGIITKESYSPFYIFFGPTGTGKTTFARIFARAMQCSTPVWGSPCNLCNSCLAHLMGRHPDIREYDIGFTRKVEDIEKMRENLIMKPLLGKKRVIILDECQEMSSTAKASLLKTFEEPPQNTIFILCTTALEEFTDTIIGRGMKFGFSTLFCEEMRPFLEKIVEGEHLEVGEESLNYLLNTGGGSLRSVIKNLEYLLPINNFELARMKELFPGKESGDLVTLVKLIFSRQNYPKAERLSSELLKRYSSGAELAISIMENITEYACNNLRANIPEALLLRDLILFELPYLKSCGKRFIPLKHLIFNLYNRHTPAEEKKLPKVDFVEQDMEIIEVLGNLLEANISRKEDYVELETIITGEKLYIAPGSLKKISTGIDAYMAGGGGLLDKKYEEYYLPFKNKNV